LRPSSCLYMTQAHCIHILVDTQQYWHLLSIALQQTP
jgi:hypothetical protein